MGRVALRAATARRGAAWSSCGRPASISRRSRGNQRRQPSAWAFHAYDSNFFSDAILGEFNTATSNFGARPIWLAEQGGLYERSGNPNVHYNTNPGPDRGQRALRHLIGHPDTNNNRGVVQRYSRITRFYYYTLRGGPDWDTGLGDYSDRGRVRVMYHCYRYKTAPRAGDREKCLQETEKPSS